MIKENRNILFLDNTSSHADAKLANIKLQFLPVKNTADMQPMDQVVIKSDENSI